ncbi:hypothetical protein BC830DRAFT_1102272 [Chytriomyces sp. MP71]|nr:hypothetical protein BC830DRAFT_1102272 [Chytriomyces sp. MP71]
MQLINTVALLVCLNFFTLVKAGGGVSAKADADVGAHIDAGPIHIGGDVGGQANVGAQIHDGKLEVNAGASGHADAHAAVGDVGVSAAAKGNVGAAVAVGADGVSAQVNGKVQGQADAHVGNLIDVHAAGGAQGGAGVAVDLNKGTIDASAHVVGNGAVDGHVGDLTAFNITANGGGGVNVHADSNGKVSVAAGLDAHAHADAQLLGQNVLNATAGVDVHLALQVHVPILGKLLGLATLACRAAVVAVVDALSIADELAASIIESLASIQVGADITKSAAGIAIHFHVKFELVVQICKHLLPLLTASSPAYNQIQAIAAIPAITYNQGADVVPGAIVPTIFNVPILANPIGADPVTIPAVVSVDPVVSAGVAPGVLSVSPVVAPIAPVAQISANRNSVAAAVNVPGFQMGVSAGYSLSGAATGPAVPVAPAASVTAPAAVYNNIPAAAVSAPASFSSLYPVPSVAAPEVVAAAKAAPVAAVVKPAGSNLLANGAGCFAAEGFIVTTLFLFV